jgi:hypothetical protein
VASLQIRHVRLLYTDVHSKRYEGVSLSHAQELLAPLASLFFAAADTVQRRLAAGTLLEGTCRAAEVTWFKLTQEHAVKCAPGMSRVDASRAIAVMASFCGYTTLLEVAEFTPRMLDRVDRGLIAMTEQQLSTSLSLLAAAVDHFLHPRVQGFAISSESFFATTMGNKVADPDLLLAYGGAKAEQLLEKWRRVEQSGEIQRRAGVRDVGTAARRLNQAAVAAAAAAASAPGLRTCALASCSAREQHPAHFKSCGACKTVAYCCKEHQVEHWPSHKAACIAARK